MDLGHLGDFALTARELSAESELQQLKRKKGQTEFLNPLSHWGYDESEQQEEEGERDEQESDVYKVGKAGSKLLYLLNRHRGLQVVSHADGVEAPKLVGRVAPTGGWADEMYYDQAGDRLIALEYTYGDFEGMVSEEEGGCCEKARSILSMSSISAGPRRE